LPTPSPDLPSPPSLSGQLVVFTGRLSSLGRKDAHALVARLGGSAADEVTAKTTMLVIGDEGFRSPRVEDGGRSQKLKRAEELNAQGGDIRILTESEFCIRVGVPTPESLKRQYSATRDLMARYRSLREDHLRYLVKCGVIRPALRTNADIYFGFGDVAAIKQANDQLAEGAAFRAIVRTLMASRHGQLAFDFRLEAAPARVLDLRQRKADRPAIPLGGAVPTTTDRDRAESFFRSASLLDDGTEGKQEDAASAYRRALECDPYLVAALINLANIHYSRDELAEAQALYERAIGLESDFFEAHFNLGNIYHDLGRFAEAEVCYSEALRLNPS
jgi:tetratricopeptide (TPR) repeat protein